ncbi:MAG: pyruvate ferredoxin oxidoreductase [Dehalococcoidia bacterium]
MAPRMIRGAQAVAEAAALCRPQVISAYPITPQTVIVEELAQMIANGKLEAEFVNVESEHSAASVVLGASATGVRVYTASSSQGLLLMSEVLYNIAGMRLPVVLTCANRSVSAPLNIWNDQQDSISLRDSGCLQFYAENNQEAVDLLLLAYRVAEDHGVMLPALVCVDGFLLPHAYEAVDVPEPKEVDAFLPPYQPLYRLDPDEPLTFGAYAEPDKYMEARYMMQRAQEKAISVIQEAGHSFEKVFGRPISALMERYRMDDASTALVAMGSVIGTIKDVVDELRSQGQRVGALKIVTYRPFPKELIYHALKEMENIIVLDKAVSLGSGGPLATEIRAAFQGSPQPPRVSGVIAGLGGRDITMDTIKRVISQAQKEVLEAEFVDLREDMELEGVD